MSRHTILAFGATVLSVVVSLHADAQQAPAAPAAAGDYQLLAYGDPNFPIAAELSASLVRGKADCTGDIVGKVDSLNIGGKPIALETAELEQQGVGPG